jgi:hypothetical protein
MRLHTKSSSNVSFINDPVTVGPLPQVMFDNPPTLQTTNLPQAAQCQLNVKQEKLPCPTPLCPREEHTIQHKSRCYRVVSIEHQGLYPLAIKPSS